MADEQLKQQVDQYVEEVWENVVEDIRSLVKIESVEDLEAAEPGTPYLPQTPLHHVFQLTTHTIKSTSALETCPASPTRI